MRVCVINLNIFYCCDCLFNVLRNLHLEVFLFSDFFFKLSSLCRPYLFVCTEKEASVQTLWMLTRVYREFHVIALRILTAHN